MQTSRAKTIVPNYTIQLTKPEHIVYGNGESRLNWKSKTSDHVVTWGCNAIYRDQTVDNLVVIDAGIQSEVVGSGYTKENKCWFAEWNPIPSEAFSVESGDVFGFKQEDLHIVGEDGGQVVIQGVDTSDERVKELQMQFPNLDKNDLELKLKKDYGMYVIYTGEHDKITPITDPVDWSAGTTAVHLACQQGAEIVYLIGFDLSSYASRINNVYKGSPHYLPPEAKGFNPVNWKNQLYLLFKEYEDVQFKWAYDGKILKQSDFKGVSGLLDLPNVETITYDNIRLT